MPRLKMIYGKYLKARALAGEALTPESERQFTMTMQLVGRSLNKAFDQVRVEEIFAPDAFRLFERWLHDPIDPQTNQKRSARTIATKLSYLRSIWRLARKMKWAALRPPRKKRSANPMDTTAIPDPWTADQVDMMIAHVEHAPDSKGWGPKCWIAFLLTSYDMSVRVGDLFTATTLEDGRIHLAISYDEKSKESDAPLSPRTIAAIREMLAERPHNRPQDPLFPKRSKEALREGLRKILIAAGLPHGPQDLFKRFRRTVAPGSRR